MEPMECNEPMMWVGTYFYYTEFSYTVYMDPLPTWPVSGPFIINHTWHIVPGTPLRNGGKGCVVGSC